MRRPDLELADEHRGPPLLALSIVTTVLFIGSMVTVAILTHGEPIPSPFDPLSESAGFFADYGTAVRLCAFLQLGAAIVLGNFAATVVSRLRFLGLHMAGVHIAFWGGIVAASFGIVAALLQWVLTQLDPVGNRELIHALHLSMFAAGGIGLIATFGLFVAGVSLTAGLTGLIPRWLMWLGLALGVVSEIGTLTLVIPAAAWLLPIARFIGLAWLIGVGATLPRSRGEAHTAPPAHPEAPPAMHPI